MEMAMARLPGAGGFYWPSRRDAWRRARVMIAAPGVEQIKVETIAGQEVGRLYRRETP